MGIFDRLFGSRDEPQPPATTTFGIVARAPGDLDTSDLSFEFNNNRSFASVVNTGELSVGDVLSGEPVFRRISAQVISGNRLDLAGLWTSLARDCAH